MSLKSPVTHCDHVKMEDCVIYRLDFLCSPFETLIPRSDRLWSSTDRLLPVKIGPHS